jgi:hypothetical protein
MSLPLQPRLYAGGVQLSIPLDLHELKDELPDVQALRDASKRVKAIGKARFDH